MSIQGVSEYPPGPAGHCARVHRDRSPRATRPLVAASANRPGVSHCLKPLRLGLRSYAAWLFCTPCRQDCLNLTSQLVCFHFKAFVLKWKSIKLLYLCPAQKTKSNPWCGYMRSSTSHISVTSQQRPVYQFISQDLADKLNPRTSFLLVDFSDFTVNCWCKSHDCGSHLKHRIDPQRPLKQGCCFHPSSSSEPRDLWPHV